MTKTLIDIQPMSANLSYLLGGLQDIHNSGTDTSKNAVLPMIQNCYRLAKELDAAIDDLNRSSAAITPATKNPATETAQDPQRTAKQDMAEINRLNSGLSEIASLCASLDLVNWELCQEVFHDKGQQRIRDAIICLSKVIGEKAEETLLGRCLRDDRQSGRCP